MQTAESTRTCIKVIVRVRPLLASESGNNSYRAVAVHPDERSVSVSASKTKQARCRYDHALGEESTQEQVYSKVASCVDSVLRGFNSTVFCYGQTATGKSHTMFGPDEGRASSHFVSKRSGIVPRAISDVFKQIPGEATAGDGVFVSFVQIYNDQIYDMFSDPGMSRPLEIREDAYAPRSRSSSSDLFIAGLSEFAVKTCAECLQLLRLGLDNRSIRETRMNKASSRSHSIFQVVVQQSRFDQFGRKRTVRGKLNLVDLAGSERWNSRKDLKMGEEQVNEMTNINSSLHVLGRCIASLSNNAQRGAAEHVPFRDSKLTRLLQDSLGGTAKTALIATLSPSVLCVEESISTLRFADRANQVMTFAHANIEDSADSEVVQRLLNEVKRLKAILQKHGIHDGEGNQGYDLHKQSDIRTESLGEESFPFQTQNSRLSMEEGFVNHHQLDEMTSMEPTSHGHPQEISLSKRSLAPGKDVSEAGRILPDQKEGQMVPLVNGRLLQLLRGIQTSVATFLDLTVEEEMVVKEDAERHSSAIRMDNITYDSVASDDLGAIMYQDVPLPSAAFRHDAQFNPQSIHTNAKSDHASPEHPRGRDSSLKRLLGSHKKLLDPRRADPHPSEEERLQKDLKAAKARKRQKEKLREWLAAKEQQETGPKNGEAEAASAKKKQMRKQRRELEAKYAELKKELEGFEL